MPAPRESRLTSALAHLSRWRLPLISAGLATAMFAGAVTGLSTMSMSPPDTDVAAVLDVPPAGTADAAGAVVEKDGWLVSQPSAATSFSRTSGNGHDQAMAHPPVPATADPAPARALPFDRKDDRARLVIIVTGIGMIRAASEAAITALPAAVTLAIDPYAVHPADWARIARRAGHEIIVGLPLEQAQSQADDAGLHALRSAVAGPQTTASLDALLAAVPGTIGVIATGGSAFQERPAALQPAAAALHARGMLLVDATEKLNLFAQATNGVQPTRIAVDMTLDDPPVAPAIDRSLSSLTALARARFSAVAVAHPYPVTLRRLQTWIGSLDHTRFVLAPVSAIAASNAGTP